MPYTKPSQSIANSPVRILDLSHDAPQAVPSSGPSRNGAAESESIPVTATDSNLLPNPSNVSPASSGGSLQEQQKG